MRHFILDEIFRHAYAYAGAGYMPFRQPERSFSTCATIHLLMLLIPAEHTRRLDAGAMLIIRIKCALIC